MRVHSTRFVWLVVGPVAFSHGTRTSGHHMGSLEAGNVEFYSNSVELNCSSQDFLTVTKRDGQTLPPKQGQTSSNNISNGVGM